MLLSQYRIVCCRVTARVIAVFFSIAAVWQFGAIPSFSFQADSGFVLIQDAGKGDSSLQSLLQQWKDLDAELATREAEFQASLEPEKQQVIREQYTALVGKANDLVGRIRAEAITAFKANSNDENTAKLLVGIIMNDAEFGRHNDAIKLGETLISANFNGRLFETGAKADRLSVDSKELLEELFIRNNQLKQNDLPQVKIETSKGEIVVELFEDEAPNTVANFISLVESKFYDGLKFHRVIEGFAAQAGDPKGDGTGGPGYAIACECYSPESRRHFVGSLSMAHAGKDTGGSQFFISLDRTADLDGKHTVFGRVIRGIDVLDKLSRNAMMSAALPNAETDLINSMIVLRKREHEYVPVKIAAGSEPTGEEKPPVQPETIRNAALTAEGMADKGATDGNSIDESGIVEEPADDGSSENGSPVVDDADDAAADPPDSETDDSADDG